MIVRIMSCFNLKMILTHGFIGNTCCFLIRIYCFAFSSTVSTSILCLHYVRHSILLLHFGYLLLQVLFWCWSSNFSFSQWAWCTMVILLFTMGVMYYDHLSFSQWAWCTLAILHFAMGLTYHGHFSFRNGRDVVTTTVAVTASNTGIITGILLSLGIPSTPVTPGRSPFQDDFCQFSIFWKRFRSHQSLKIFFSSKKKYVLD
jgi:hypothetical protein